VLSYVDLTCGEWGPTVDDERALLLDELLEFVEPERRRGRPLAICRELKSSLAQPLHPRAGADDVALKVRCLGSFAILGADGWIAGPSLRKGRELLQYLAVYPRSVVSRERLAEAFWPELDPGMIAHRVHLAASAARAVLRQVLAGRDAIRCIDGGYAWQPELVLTSDLEEFLAFSATPTVEAAHRGISLYGGEFLAGEHADWLLPLRVLCASEHVCMLERIARDSFERRDYAQGLHYGMLIVDADRGHERAVRFVMRCFAALGRPEAARAQYQALERYLARHLGVAPMQETTQLLGAILANESYDGASESYAGKIESYGGLR
jgi:DNA-binding SARP family transcriptional activator